LMNEVMGGMFSDLLPISSYHNRGGI
jgi:hypothetical protein